MTYRLSEILQGRQTSISGMACPRQVIRNSDGKVVAYIDSLAGPPVTGSLLSKAQVKALGPLRRPG